MKICLVCAPGGHLTEMLRLNEAFVSNETFLITYNEKFSNLPQNIKKTYFIKNVLVNNVGINGLKKKFLIGFQILLLAIHELKIFLIEWPDVVISTGSEIAIPIFYFAKLFGRKVIYIESLCRVQDLSGTGKIVRPISDLFLVQWENLTKKYKNTLYKGNLFYSTLKSKSHNSKNNTDSFIFVTVGTASFPRLVKMMDEISKKVNSKIIMQIANTSYKPQNLEYLNYVEDSEEIKRLNREASVVICHAGVGSILTALEQGSNIIVVPRLKKFKECIDDHQLEIATILKNQNRGEVAYNATDLVNLLNSSTKKKIQKNKVEDDELNIINFLKDILISDFKVINN